MALGRYLIEEKSQDGENGKNLLVPEGNGGVALWPVFLLWIKFHIYPLKKETRHS